MFPFQRFTEAAKRVLVLAQEEAERLHQSYIGTEHLLVGLLGDADGRAAMVLTSLGVEITTVRSTIGSILGRNDRIVIQQIVPTSRVKKVIEISFDEARRLGSDHVGTDHLLLGLLIEGEGIAAHVLKDLGANLETVRDRLAGLPPTTEVGSEAPAGANPPGHAVRPTTTADDDPRFRVVGEVVRCAVAAAGERREPFGTEHLLLALAAEDPLMAGEILRSHGLDRAAIETILDGTPPARRPPTPRAESGEDA